MSNIAKNTYAGTPEGYLTPCKANELDTDAISCVFSRASALLNLLHTQFSEDDVERLSNETILNALWGVEGYLDQLKILLKNQ